jgi:hypothetical protein
MQLKRDMLEQWHNQPFFDEVVRGCVVRIVYGTFVDAAGQKQPNYLMMRVVEATDRQPYRRVRVWGSWLGWERARGCTGARAGSSEHVAGRSAARGPTIKCSAG